MRKYLAASIFFGATLGLVGLLSLFTPYLELLELTNFDFMLSVLRGPEDPPEEMVIIGIDQSSFDEFQNLGLSWPWPRYVHAELIKSLNQAGVRAIVFDVIFDQESEFDDDLAAAIKESPVPVILAATEDAVNDPRFGVLKKQVLPVEKFRDAGAEVGYATMNPDPDDVLRHARLSVNEVPSLAAQVYKQLRGKTPELSTLPVVRYQLDDPEILVNYVGGAPAPFTPLATIRLLITRCSCRRGP